MLSVRQARGHANGHGGWGGSVGFADPEAGLAVGYAMNQMNTTPRYFALAEATYRALGYRKGKCGL
jgi:CubicO group peptidase (beta-lactamase class C family)